MGCPPGAGYRLQWKYLTHLMKTPNQIHRKREEIRVTAKDLLEVPDGNDYRRWSSHEY